MTASVHRLPSNLTPRGLRREAAAGYIGISASFFDQLVTEGRMPLPKLVNRVKIWDRLALDAAFELLPSGDDGEPAENEWDAMLRA